jgi:hypothetical protein
MQLTPDQLKQAKKWQKLRDANPKGATTEEILDNMSKKEAVNILKENIRVLKQRLNPDGTVANIQANISSEEGLLKRYEN